jgi:hypothetical protein
MDDATEFPAPRAPIRASDEVLLLRQGLWECYAIAGGDPQQYADHELDDAALVALVVDCVRDLRGFFDAARRDLR